MMKVTIPFRLPSLNDYINESRKNKYGSAKFKKKWKMILTWEVKIVKDRQYQKWSSDEVEFLLSNLDKPLLFLSEKFCLFMNYLKRNSAGRKININMMELRDFFEQFKKGLTLSNNIFGVVKW